jgi:glycosyltransferase involved in cell wall biosynthesis
LKHRVVILTEIIAPYRIPVFNALAARSEIDLHVVFLSETDPGLRQWKIYRDEIKFSYEVLRSRRYRWGGMNLILAQGVVEAMKAARPRALLCGGYNYIAAWQAQRWARKNGVAFLLWSESNIQDARGRFFAIEAAKSKFIRSCQGYVVPGVSAETYLRTFGVPKSRIFRAPNAVDVERFSTAADQARHDFNRQKLGLPERYLLFVGRLVKAKGVFDLMAAYATLPEEIRQDVGLVFAGDGGEREELARRAQEISPGRIIFSGFLQRDELPTFYAFAEALVFPTHSDTWGLVVNEALACGLPVIASEMAGCVADLVQDGENGLVVPARNPKALSQSMQALMKDRTLRKKMGEASLKMNLRFTPDAWAEGIVSAVQGTPGENRG